MVVPRTPRRDGFLSPFIPLRDAVRMVLARLGSPQPDTSFGPHNGRRPTPTPSALYNPTLGSGRAPEIPALFVLGDQYMIDARQLRGYGVAEAGPSSWVGPWLA
jgi:hypothetical protein